MNEPPSQCHDESQESVRENTAPVQIVRLELSERALSVIAIVLATLAIGLSILAIVLSQLSEREAKLAREDVIVLEKSMIARGIETDQHAIEKGK